MTVLTPAADLPWTLQSPFRMRPGLSRLPAQAPQVALFDLPLRQKRWVIVCKKKI